MRTTTQILGTVASDIAAIILAPCLMMPCRSTAVPTMKPGTSARNSSGMPNASQVWMNRAALSAESTNSTPPLNMGLFAITPVTCPSSRAKPVTTSRAHSAWTSKKESSSTSPRTNRRMSKACRSLSGTRARRSVGLGSRASATGSGEAQFCGR